MELPTAAMVMYDSWVQVLFEIGRTLFQKWIVFYFLLAFVVARALASPYGAPVAACWSMTPGHGFDPRTEESPFIILPLMV